MFKLLVRYLSLGAILFTLSIPQTPVSAAPNLTVESITWNVIGLDSNNVNVGPNNFPVGARVCNTGDAATNVTANFVWDSANSYIYLRPGSLQNITLPTLAAGSAASPSCYDFYFEVTIERNASAYDTTRSFHIDVTADGGISLSTPTPREIYVEHLISQNRNSTNDVKLNGTSIPAGGTMSLQVGNTYTIELDASTATQGYNQLEDFINFPNTIFQVLSVQSHYSADSSGYVANSSDKLYADACLWDNDPTSPTYRSCIGSDGKIGGTISTTYTVKIIGGAGTSQPLNTLIYDFSGSSYHYNSDFSSESRIAYITSSLSMTKSFSPASITSGGTSTLSIAIANSSSSDVTDVSLTDPMPSGVTISGTATTTCGGSISNTADSLTLSNGTIPTTGCTIQATVTSSTNGTYVNDTDDLYINGSDSGTNASANLIVSTAPSGACDVTNAPTIASWTNFTSAAPATPSGAPSTFSNSGSQTFSGGEWRIGDASVSSTNPIDIGTDKYFGFQIDTANYTNVWLTFTYDRGASGAIHLDVYYGNSYIVSTSTPVNPVLLSGATYTPGTTAQTVTNLDFTGKANPNGYTDFFLYVYDQANSGGNAWTGISNVTFTGCRPSQAITKAFSPSPIAAGYTSTLTFTLNNLDGVDATGASFTDTLPSGLTIATNAATSQCNGTVTGTAGASTISLSGGTIPANGSCTVVVDVTASTAGTYPNTSSYLTANGNLINSQASDTLTVLAPPTISKSFSPNPIYAGDSSTLTFTITNPNAGIGLSDVGFTDVFPTTPDAMTLANTTTTNTCGGSLTDNSGNALSTSPASVGIKLSGGSLSAGGSCIVSVVVTASAIGSYANTSGNVSAVISGVTYNGNTASDTLGVQTTHPGISILKQVSTSASGPWASTVNVAPGGTVYYRFTIENIGDVPLSPVSVTDDTLNISSCTWPSTLPVGTSTVDPTATCVVSITADASIGSYTNTATAHGTYNNTVYDSSPSTATYATSDLTLVKSVTESSFSAAGDTLHYSYTITNNGSTSLALPATVTDSNTSVVCPAVDTSGNHDASLDPSESIVCTATYTVSAFDMSVGSVTNTAYATVDSVRSNTDRVTVYKNLPDLVVSKDNDVGGNVPNGTPFNWTLTVSNQGPQDASFADTQTILSDQLPTTGASYGSLPATLTIGSSTGITGTVNCSIDASALLTCAASGPVTISATTGSFSVSVPVTPSATGSLVNSSAVVDPDGVVTESNEGNNTGSDAVTVTSSAPNLGLSKSDGVTTVDAGGTTTYALTVSNTGNAATSGTITVVDVLPSGMSISDGSVTLGGTNSADWSCSAASNVITCTSSTAIAASTGTSEFSFIVDVVPNASGTLTNKAQVGGGGDPTNSAAPTSTTAGQCTGADTPNEGCAVDSDTVSGVYDPPTAIKTFSASGLPQLEFRMVWINSGNNFAIDVQVTDGIPAGTTYVVGSVTCDPRGSSTNAASVSSPLSATAIPDPVCGYDAANSRIQWQGTIGPDSGNTTEATAANEVVIIFRVTVNNGVNRVQNQGFARVDVNANGNFDEETVLGTSLIGSNLTVWTRGGGTGATGNGAPVTFTRLPRTGFAPGIETILPARPAEQAYTVQDGLWLEIPRLDVQMPIVGVPFDDGTWDVTWLSDQAGWLQGTAFPTWNGNSVLTGHIYDANGLPGPFVDLNTLKWGDQIIIHLDGQRFLYQVRENKVVSPNDVTLFKHEDYPWLTLLTCKDYNAGTDTYSHRVAVGAILIKVESDASPNPGGGR